MEIVRVDRQGVNNIIVTYNHGVSVVYSAKQLKTLEPIQQTDDSSELPLPRSAPERPE
jgi:hypothetical protein